MFPATLWGFLEPLIEAIDWNKLAVPAGGIGIFSVAYYVSSKLAQRSVKMRLEELESEVRTEKSAHQVAKATVESLKIQQAAYAATMESQVNTIKQVELQLKTKQMEYDKLSLAAHKIHRAYLDLKPLKEAHEKAATRPRRGPGQNPRVGG